MLEIAKPGAPVIFSISKIAIEEGGFGERIADLERSGAWSLEEQSDPFRTSPFSSQYASLRHWINVVPEGGIGPHCCRVNQRR